MYPGPWPGQGDPRRGQLVYVDGFERASRGPGAAQILLGIHDMAWEVAWET